MTCGVATRFLLDGHPAVKKPSVVAPCTKDICDAIMEILEKEGIVLVEVKVA